jgi:hypothetical protein
MVAGGLIATRLVTIVRNSFADQYAALQVKEMLIEFMMANDGDWPKDWEDLNKAYESVAKKGGDYCTFRDIRERVVISFELTPATLSQVAQQQGNDSPTFISLRSGRDAVWYGVDMNQRIAEHLRARHEALRKRNNSGIDPP